MKDKLKISKNRQGFSLIEIIVSLSIFSLIITGITLFGVRTIDARTKSQAMQNAIQNARFLTEKINKRIRTSYDVSGGDSEMEGGTTEIFVIDNVNEYRYCYKFENGSLTVAEKDNSIDVASCDDFDNGEFRDLIGGDGVDNIKVEGKFYVKKTDLDQEKRGFVRTVLKIIYNQEGGYQERDEVIIQSGVSLRDY